MFSHLSSLQAHLCCTWCPGQARPAPHWKSLLFCSFLRVPHALFPDLPQVFSPMSPSQWVFSCYILNLTFSLLFPARILSTELITMQDIYMTNTHLYALLINTHLHALLIKTHLYSVLIFCLLYQDPKGIFGYSFFTVESRGHIKTQLTISPTQVPKDAGRSTGAGFWTVQPLPCSSF